MHSLSAFGITARWPPKYPDRLQLYSAPTTNGAKVAIMLEEICLPYEAHFVSCKRGDELSPEFQSLSPSGRVPLVIDPDGPAGQPFSLFDAGAILMYLGKKTGVLLPRDTTGRYEALQWILFQAGAIEASSDRLLEFPHTHADDQADSKSLHRVFDEFRRVLRVLDIRLRQRPWLLGVQYSIADIAVFSWVNSVANSLVIREAVHIQDYDNVHRTLTVFLERAAVIRGLRVPAGS